MSVVPAVPPPPPPQVKRDEHGWGIEDDFGPIEKIGTAAGRDPGRTRPPPPPPAAKKPVFGKPRRRYSERL